MRVPKWLPICLGWLMIIHRCHSTTICPNGTVWQPAPGTTFYWSLSQDITIKNVQSSSAQAFDFDMWWITNDMIELIHSLNRTLICYIDTAYEPYRPDSFKFTPDVLGNDMTGWPGQKWVNISSPIVMQIMVDRLAIAVQIGCDGIEWDDVDAYTNNNGFRLGPNDQLNFNLFLANITHSAGLSVGLKNDYSQASVLQNYFDWALDESCLDYNECNKLVSFTQQHKAVFAAEYTGNPKSFCPTLNAMGFTGFLTDQNVQGSHVVYCCQYASPPCPSAPYRCSIPLTNYTVYPEDSGDWQTYDSDSSASGAGIAAPFAWLMVVVVAAGGFL